ncbi:MAG: response regulator transcription factor [Planctomycetota bacterium]|jgi:DNA-binding response OmpR family regulator
MSPRILLVEDDADLVRALRVNLEHEGHDVEWAEDGERGLAAALVGGHDLVLLDVMLPKRDGFAVLEALREAGSGVPVICLTARGQEADIVAGLSLGADDYVVKPFSVAELMARIEALFRRTAPGASAETVDMPGGVRLDVAARRVTLPGGGESLLTPIELDLLRYLLDRRGAAVPREEILRDLWGLDRYATTRTLDNHVARIRKKVEPDPAEPAVILTVHGVGYRVP